MAKAHCWVTEILEVVEDNQVTDKVIGKEYNFRVYTNGKFLQRLGLNYKAFDEEFGNAVFENDIKPAKISNSPPKEYETKSPFKRERELRDDDLE